MDFDEFKKRLEIIFNHFQAKPPDKYAPGLWYEHVKQIPSGPPLNFIVDQILNLDSLPRNMTKAFKNGWYAWMNANQDKIAQQRANAKTKCNYCGGSGLIHFSGKIKEMTYQYVCRCPECSNWVDQVSSDLPAYAKGFLQQRGYQVVEPISARFPTTKRDFKVLAGGIG